jgi:acetyl-CoA C-acetyltransferase
VAPRLTASALGLAPDTPRPLTITGGLPWFGGPGNNYATHAVAAMTRLLRKDPAARGLVHALGWNLTKHALAVYATAPAPGGWRRAGAEAQAWVDAQPRPELAEAPNGRGTIETYTVTHDRGGGPDAGVVIGRLADGARFVARLPADGPLLASLEQEEGVGRTGTVAPGERGNVFSPD